MPFAGILTIPLSIPAIVGWSCLLALGFVMAIVAIVKLLNGSKRTSIRSWLLCAIALAAIALAIVSGTFLCVNLDADAHGRYSDDPMALGDAIGHNKTSPVDQSSDLEAFLENASDDNSLFAVVYLYRYTCPDCEDVHGDVDVWLADLRADLAPRFPVISVSTRSDAGKALCTELGVDEVPAVAIIGPALEHNGFGDGIWSVIYERADNGSAMLDENVLDDITAFIRNDLKGSLRTS